MSRTAKIVVAVLAGVVVLYLALVVGLVLVAGGGDGISAGGTIGVVHLEGVVSGSAASDPLTGTQGIDPEWTAGTLREADRDGGIDAVVLRVDSPGGSPAASWEIYQAVSEMEKPVVVSVADVAASGAYYFSSAADVIVAAPSSQVGSIGVILAAMDLEELLEKLGMNYTVLTRGEFKDMGHISRGLAEEEKEILRQQMDLIYQQFIADVAEGREPLSVEEVEELANGLTFPGEEALDKGLIDRTGSYRDALDAAAELSGLEPDEYEVRSLDEDRGLGLWSLLFGMSGEGELREWARQVLKAAGAGVLPNSVPLFR